MTDKITMRPATWEDYANVLEIYPNMWDGHDYLPSKYKKIVNDPNRSTYVVELNGKIVSSNTATIN